ncbi:hypothetical protein [Cryobacterium sp. TMS1-13-1]|uniref:hypothetical protein n=1 Tax=Cryobacterium sp. TMS1-13-1 TaxID=1259220 RepID=UPI00106D661F|nr:hypothetical protein [Cryobacterium sp. TMS1-13-1]TFD19196.1 hypothetical protein E3T31_16575 [Cryobacterium sp. TMS1-13-1]
MTPDEQAMPARRSEHPVLEPARLVFGQLGISVEPLAVVVMASGVNYLGQYAKTLEAFGGFDGAFDLFEAAGFNCEQFRSSDPHVFLEAARREHDLLERRWKATAMFSYFPQRLPHSDVTAILPVALSEFTDESVRITSISDDRAVSYADFVETELEVWGYAAPVPSLHAIITPKRYLFAERARRSLRLLLQRMLNASDGLCVLDQFLASRPDRAEIDRYRARLRAFGCGDLSFFRSTITGAIDTYGESFVSEKTRQGFDKSAKLHVAFLAGDDAALAEIAQTERTALCNPRRATMLQRKS